MKMNIKHILEGIKNSFFVKEEVEEIAKERYTICSGCPKDSKNISMGDPGPYVSKLRVDEYCTMCACNIHAKVRSLHTACPLDKWLAVASIEEAAKVAAVIDGNNI